MSLPLHRIAVVLLALPLLVLACTDDDPVLPEAADRTIVVTLAGDGSGHVTSDPAGIDCTTAGGVCSVEFEEGTTVVLSASADGDHTFAGWSGACSGLDGCSVTIGAAGASVGAGFDDPDIVQALIPAAGGTLETPNGRLTITVPAGAVPSDQDITIERIDAADLGAEWAALVEADDIEFAYELGPDGLTFDRPLEVSFLSEQVGFTDSTGFSLGLELLLTMEEGETVALDGMTYDVDAATGAVRVSGSLAHFTPLIKTRRSGRIIGEVSGIPTTATVDEPFEARARLVALAPYEIWQVKYVDGSTAPVSTSSTGELPFTESEPFRQYELTVPYTCTDAGPGRYEAVFDVIPQVLAGQAIIELGNTILRFHRDVTCERPTQVLTVNVVGDGIGRVVSDPAGIDCTTDGGTCQAPFSDETTVELTAEPGENSLFDGWSGDLDFDTPLDALTVSALMWADRTVQASFVRPLYELTVDFTGNATGEIAIEPGGQTCAKEDGAQDAQCVLELAAGEYEAAISLDDAHEVSTQTGCESLLEDVCRIVLVADQTITIATAARTSLVQVELTGDGEGTVVSTGDGAGVEHYIDCGEICSAEIPWGTELVLTATSTGASTFTRWSGDCSGMDPSYEVVVEGPLNCTAVFVSLSELFIEVFGEGTGSVTVQQTGDVCSKDVADEDVSCAYQLPEGTYDLAITSDVGAEAAVEGCTVVDDACQVELVDDTNIRVNLPSGLHPLVVTKSGDGDGFVAGWDVDDEGTFVIDCGAVCSVGLPVGTIVHFEAEADENSVFAGWTGDCAPIGEDSEVASVVTGFEESTCDARFDAMPEGTFYALELVVAGEGTGRITTDVDGVECVKTGSEDAECTFDVAAGTVVTATAEPDESSEFGFWFGDGVDGPDGTIRRVARSAQGPASVRVVTMDTARDFGAFLNLKPPSITSATIVGAEGSDQVAFGVETVIRLTGTRLDELTQVLMCNPGCFAFATVGATSYDSADIAVTARSTPGPVDLLLDFGGPSVRESFPDAFELTALHVSPTGSDAGRGTQDDPFATFAHAYTFAGPDAFMHLTAGDHDLTPGGFDITGATITGAGADVTALHGNGTGTAFLMPADANASSRVSNLTLTGFENGLVIEGSFTSTTLDSVTIADNAGDGVIVADGGRLVMNGGVVSGNGSDGLRFAGEILVVNGTTFDANGVGIHLANADGSTLTDVTVTGSKGAAGVHMESSSEIEFRGAVVSDNAGHGILATGGRFDLDASTIARNAGAGVHLTDADVQIDSSTVQDNGSGVVVLTVSPGTSTATLTESDVTGNDGVGITLEGYGAFLYPSKLDQDGGSVSSNGGAGILAVRHAEIVLDSAQITDNGGEGLRCAHPADVEGQNRLQITGSSFARNALDGVYLAFCVGWLIESTFDANGGYQLYDDRPPYGYSFSATDNVWVGVENPPVGTITEAGSYSEGDLNVWIMTGANNILEFGGE